MRLSLLVLFGLLVGAALARTHTVYADEDDDNNDNSQALEEEDSAPVVAETHNFANDVDDDDDDDAPSVASASKVFSHIESLQEAISSSSLESEDLDAALDNLKHIKQDAHRMEHESASSRQSLKQAIHLRMEALKMQLKGDADAEAKDDDDDDDDNVVAAKDNVLEEKPGDDDEENDIAGADDDNNNKNDDEDAIQKITKDISRVQDGINADVLGQKMARKAMRNLDAIRTDASRYETSDSATREKLSKAMKLRVAALKLMLEAPEAPSYAEDPIAHSAKRVEGDIAHIESEINKAGLSKHAKREALDNLHAMKRDAEELASKPTLTRSRQLKRAMKLRMHALHEQLQ